MPLPDAKWLEALKLPLRVMIGITLGVAGILWLDFKQLFELTVFGAIVKPLLVVVCVIAGAISLSGMVAMVYDSIVERRKEKALDRRRELRKKDEEEKAENAKSKALERLEYLSEEELYYIADCLRKRSQSFTAWVHSSGAATLVTKGLAYTPGGTHHQDNYPFVINDFAWKELLHREAEFISRDDRNTQQREAARSKRR